jgi:hypothetical protein
MSKVSKISRAIELVNSYKQQGMSRKDILFSLTKDLDTTWRSASTFYHRVNQSNKEKEVV